MFENNVEAMKMARALAQHASARQGVIARNIAHADTPGYRAQDLPSFAETYRDQMSTPLRATRSGHDPGPRMTTLSMRPVTGEPSPNGNSVSLEAEMVKAAETRHQHDMALAIYKSLSGMIRTSLGRGR